MGHTSCKAISTAIEGVAKGSYLFPLVKKIREDLGEPVKGKLGEKTEKKMQAWMKQNVISQKEEMIIRSSIIQRAIIQGLTICPTYYDVTSGEVHWL